MNNVFGYIKQDIKTNPVVDLDFSEIGVGIKKLKVWVRYFGSTPSNATSIPSGYEDKIQLYPFTAPNQEFEFPIVAGKSPCDFYLAFNSPSSSQTITVMYLVEEFGGEPDKDYVKLNFNGTYKG